MQGKILLNVDNIVHPAGGVDCWKIHKKHITHFRNFYMRGSTGGDSSTVCHIDGVSDMKAMLWLIDLLNRMEVLNTTSLFQQEEVQQVMKDWGFKDANTAETFLKCNQRRQKQLQAHARKRLLRVRQCLSSRFQLATHIFDLYVILATFDLSLAIVRLTANIVKFNSFWQDPSRRLARFRMASPAMADYRHESHQN